ncbi:hypothetical protein LTS08_007566 [Lithohypha guttulata]|nr:hypothetical protein LTS08_007566 [Lithohypha guttulata]
MPSTTARTTAKEDENKTDNVGIKWRRWGKLNSRHAAIMPFKMKAGQKDPCRILEYKVDIVLHESEPQPLVPDEEVNEVSVTTASVVLLDDPRPQNYLTGTCQAERMKSSSKPWKLSSRAVNLEGSCIAKTARWEWTANKNDPQIVHGAIVVGHSGSMFSIACSVEGSARDGRARFIFKNSRHAHELWPVHPKLTEADLESHVESLEVNIREANYEYTHAGGRGDLTTSRAQNDTIALRIDPGVPRGHTYETTNIHDSARVHMGNTIGPNTFNFYTREEAQQHN